MCVVYTYACVSRYAGQVLRPEEDSGVLICLITFHLTPLETGSLTEPGASVATSKAH